MNFDLSFQSFHRLQVGSAGWGHSGGRKGFVSFERTGPASLGQSIGYAGTTGTHVVMSRMWIPALRDGLAATPANRGLHSTPL